MYISLSDGNYLRRILKPFKGCRLFSGTAKDEKQTQPESEMEMTGKQRKTIGACREKWHALFFSEEFQSKNMGINEKRSKKNAIFWGAGNAGLKRRSENGRYQSKSVPGRFRGNPLLLRVWDGNLAGAYLSFSFYPFFP